MTNTTATDVQLFSEGENSFFNFDYAKSRVEALIRTWDPEINATQYRRRVRNIAVNVLELRAQGKLKPDETIITTRLVDTNIKRAMPAKMAYLKQSRRVGIFKCLDNPDLDSARLEADFTRVFQYKKWETDFEKLIDGSDAHGWDAVEVCFDASKPGKFCFDHVGHDCLFFPLDARNNIQSSPFVVRSRKVTLANLRSFVIDDGFDKEQAEILARDPGSSSELSSKNNVQVTAPADDSTREIYKVSFRDNRGTIFVFWHGKNCTNYLKAPQKLFLGVKHQEMVNVPFEVPVVDPFTGIQVGVEQQMKQELQWVDTPISFYPYVQNFHEETEEQTIADHKGVIWKDEYKQEALVAVWSSFVNGCVRASNVHACPKNPQGGISPKQTNVIIEHGKMWTEPVDFFNTPYPDPIMLKAAQAIDIQNSNETGQLTYAANNREDSRKTATEISSAKEDQSLLSGVSVTNFSVFLREAIDIAWLICKSQALQNKIKFCLIPTEPDLETGKMQYANDLDYIDHEFEIFAAGDIDVVQRAEKLAEMQQDWGIISQTPLAQTFLIDYVKTKYPNDGQRYEQVLKQGFAQIQQAQMQLAQQGNEPQVMQEQA